MSTRNEKVTATRRNPMTEVVDYDLLRTAITLIRAKQNHEYWDTVPVPVRPLGVVRFEAARQFATFAIPVAGLFGAWMTQGAAVALMAIPAALVGGYLLDRQLTAANKAQEGVEQDRDRGRYQATKLFCERLGLKPEEVTLSMVIKMANDFVVVDAALKEKAAREAEAREYAERARASLAASAYPARGTRQRKYAAAATTALTTAVVEHEFNQVGDAVISHHTEPVAPQFNIANGNLMVTETMDVMGNPYGTDNNHVGQD